MTSRRFSDAKDLQTMGRLLDESELAKRATFLLENALFPQLAWTKNPIEEGKLVQALTGDVVRLADSSDSRLATGICVKVKDKNRIYWSPLAFMPVKLLGTVSDQFQELWLGEEGVIKTSAPATTGQMVQKVGLALNYRGTEKTYNCLIFPALGGFNL